jgi:hypothetical protein
MKSGGKDIYSPLKINGEPYQYFNTTSFKLDKEIN